MENVMDNEKLFAGERVLERAEIHWNAFTLAYTVALLGIVLILAGMHQKALFGWGACFLATAAYMNYKIKTTQMLCTNKRIMVRSGLFLQEISLKSIESIAVLQTGVGKSLGYGDIRFTCSQNRIITMHKVRNPIIVKNRFKDIIIENRGS